MPAALEATDKGQTWPRRTEKRKTSRGAVKKTRAGKKPSLAGGRHYDGPEEWLLSMLEETYSRIRTKAEAEAIKPTVKPARARKVKKGGKAEPFASTIHEGHGESVLAPLPSTYWEDQFAKFHERRV